MTDQPKPEDVAKAFNDCILALFRLAKEMGLYVEIKVKTDPAKPIDAELARLYMER